MQHFWRISNSFLHQWTQALSSLRPAECIAGEVLMLVHDLQNEHDLNALTLRTVDRHIVGFCPRYLVKDFHQLIDHQPQSVRVVVEKVNPTPTPLQFRLLCKLTAKWGQGFQPFSSDEYQLLINTPLLLAQTH